MWDQLKYKGILHGRLIDHVWERFPSETRQQLIGIMEEFDLVCVAQNKELTQVTSSLTSDDTHPGGVISLRRRNHYVPSLFDPENVKTKSDQVSWVPLTFFVDFQGCFTGRKIVLLIIFYLCTCRICISGYCQSYFSPRLTKFVKFIVLPAKHE